MNKTFSLTSGLVLCLLLSACGSSVSIPSSSESTSGSEKSSDTVSVTVKDKTSSKPLALTVEKKSEVAPTLVEEPILNITASQSGFFPATLETKAGVVTKLHFTSADVRHSFVIPVLGYRVEIPARSETTLDILVKEPGSYPFLSDIYSGENMDNLRGLLLVR